MAPLGIPLSPGTQPFHLCPSSDLLLLLVLFPSPFFFFSVLRKTLSVL